MQTDSTLTQLLQSVEQNGVCVEREIHGFPMTGVDIVLPHVVLLLCLRGSARIMFDMKELSVERNDYRRYNDSIGKGCCRGCDVSVRVQN